jgi:bifunctional non-homologous end joining protein LigD
VVSYRDLALPTISARPFSSLDWLYELKYDGYRVLAMYEATVRLVSRQGRDLTAAFPEVASAVSALVAGTALDGELVILDAEGRPKFDYLARTWRSSPAEIRRAVMTRPATMMAFDILIDAGVDVRDEPIEERKERLVTRVQRSPHLLPVLPVTSAGEWLFAQAEAMNLEGVVAKRKGSPYRAGRTSDWLKIKTQHGRAVEAKRFSCRR